MADPNRFRLKQSPTDVWSVRERLALASSVSRSGDQNWVSVSRAVRPFGVPNRPSDWFSQKNCALQYSELLENVETPRRKRNEREAVETPGDVIVRKLTIERIEELKKLIAKEAEEYRTLKKDLEAVRSGQHDGQIKEMWERLQADKATAAAAASKAATDELAARERAKAAAMKFKKSSSSSLKSFPLSDLEDSTQDSLPFDPFVNEDSNISLVSSVPTPGPLQPTDAGLSVASPVAGSVKSQSPKSELLQMVEESLPKKLDLTVAIQATDSEESDEIRMEIKRQKSLEDETERKADVGSTCDSTVKIEEQELIETVPQDVAESACDDLEVNTETVASGKGFAEDDEADDEDDLNLFTPEEEQSDLDASRKVVVEESCEMEPSAQGFLANEEKEEYEENTENLVYEVEEEVYQNVEEYKEEEEEEKETEEKHNILQEELTAPEGEETDQKTHLDLVEMEEPKVEDEEEEEEEVSARVAADPASPTSSVVSSETVRSKKLNRRGRGRRRKRTAKPSNKIQHQMEEEKESGLSSKEGETSDEEGSRVQPPENDDSNLLSSLPQHLDPNESLPNSPASLSISDTEDEKSYRVWKKSIMLVWRAATNHKCASVFLHPVTEDIAPGYRSIVHKPMDLQKIKRKIDNGEIRTTAEFQRDMMLMFTNAIMYNNSDHDVHKMAKNMYKDVMGHIEQFVSTQIMVQAEPKLLRTLRRAEASATHSDKEDETKRKRSTDSDQTPSTTGAKVKKRRI